jgi:hypothetical protein
MQFAPADLHLIAHRIDRATATLYHPTTFKRKMPNSCQTSSCAPL